MAIKTVELDLRDLESYRNEMKKHGFMSASYLSMSGFDVKKLRKLAEQGKMNAIRCVVGKSVRWYYYETHAELAHLKGEA